MNKEEMARRDRTAAVWQVEIAVAAVLVLAALVVMGDSLRIGMGWAPDGPEAGFFPFYIGLILLAASLVTLVSNLRPAARDEENFVDRPALRSVMAVLLPAIGYVVALRWLGIYVASAALILFFMRAYGRHPYTTGLGVGVGVALALFLLFEVWFLVPLPKGPLESALGF